MRPNGETDINIIETKKHSQRPQLRRKFSCFWLSIYLFIIYLLLKSYTKYMIDRQDRQMKIKTQKYHKTQPK